MSKLLVYAVKDTKADAFMNPFYARKLGEATRAFQDEVEKPGSAFGKHPDDFNLFELGEWCQMTGALYPHDCPRSIGTARSFSPVNL